MINTEDILNILNMLKSEGRESLAKLDSYRYVANYDLATKYGNATLIDNSDSLFYNIMFTRNDYAVIAKGTLEVTFIGDSEAKLERIYSDFSKGEKEHAN